MMQPRRLSGPSDGRTRSGLKMSSSRSTGSQHGTDKKGDAEKKEKEKGFIDKLMGKVREKMSNDYEATKMSTDFETATEKFDRYKDAIDHVVDRLESVLQQNGEIMAKNEVEAPVGQDPYDKLANAIDGTYRHVADAHSYSVAVDLTRRLAALHRDVQKRGRRAIHRMRLFVANDWNELELQRKVLRRRREDMDQMRHDVKKATTTEAIESKGEKYKETATSFEEQVDKVLRVVEALPVRQEEHRRELAKFFDTLRGYHEEACRSCEDSLNRFNPPLQEH